MTKVRSIQYQMTPDGGSLVQKVVFVDGTHAQIQYDFSLLICTLSNLLEMEETSVVECLRDVCKDQPFHTWSSRVCNGKIQNSHVKLSLTSKTLCLQQTAADNITGKPVTKEWEFKYDLYATSYHKCV